ncbi:hypothetical protein BDZ97DRAFT_1395061 [Flammula alnicola]|nr:hypothetical protein BDZ97DRAFT_1395061 [Flammula alnicola]
MSIDNGLSAELATLTLPLELVDHILQYACILSTSFCLALSQLSKWTRQLALPYLYSTIIIKKLRTATVLPHILQTTPYHSPIPAFLPKVHVRSLWIEAVSNRTLEFFRYCDNASNIALNNDNFLWLVQASSSAQNRMPFLSGQLSGQSILRKPDLHLLMLDAKRPDWSLAPLADSDPSPLFNKITHLRIGRIGPYTSHLDLAHFKRLSHIAIPYHFPQQQPLSELLRVFDFPSTIFLVVVLVKDALSELEYRNALEWIIETRTANPKVYAIASEDQDLQKEWEEEARRGLDIWSKAEMFTQTLTSQP